MDSETFRKHAHTLVDWMADYMTDVETYPVRAQVKPGEIAAKIPDSPPSQAESMEAIFADFKGDILPGLTHWQHSELLCLLSGQQQSALRAGRNANRDLGGAVHALADLAGGDRARNQDDGLVAPDDRFAGGL